MKFINKKILGIFVLALLLGSGVISTNSVLARAGNQSQIAAGETSENEVPITGNALEKASRVALSYTGGNRVTETEVGDEESYYEVEVTLNNGQQVDVQLDEYFKVVGEKIDNENEIDR